VVEAEHVPEGRLESFAVRVFVVVVVVVICIIILTWNQGPSARGVGACHDDG
jgi:hypothetical protein